MVELYVYVYYNIIYIIYDASLINSNNIIMSKIRMNYVKDSNKG